jgi:hypothetical protein
MHVEPSDTITVEYEVNITFELYLFLSAQLLYRYSVC